MHPIPPLSKPRVRQAGLSLVELMIAITIGLIITAGLTTIFVSNSQAQGEIERANRQIENGRYAMQLLTEDLRHAGFYGELDPTILDAPAAIPDPCLTLPADLRGGIPLHIQGYDVDGTAPSISCLSDVRSGTDIFVVRRVSTCVAGVGECEAVIAGVPYFQASRCSDISELSSGDKSDFYALDTDINNLNRHKRDCTALADIRRYRTHIYFIANNTDGTDGIPTLKRAELGSDGALTDFSVIPLVAGIENMQLEYGLDTDDDGRPNAYTTDPGSYNACAAAACAVDNWQDVVAVKLSLLARNTEASAGHADTKTYTLGLNADGSENTVGPFNDRVKRHAYQSFVKLSNPAGRRE